jgi:hypothetical protein
MNAKHKSIKADLTAPVPTKTLPPAPANAEARKARCFDAAWEYTPANSTDLAAKFKRIKREQKQSEASKQPHVVAPIRRKA